MKLKKAISCAVVAAMCMAFISGCGGSKKQDVVKIGLLAPLTGGNAALGVGMKNSGQLAVDQANKSGKYPFKFELVTVDDAGDPSTAVAAMNKLIADKGISAITGHFNSGCALATAPVAHKAEREKEQRAIDRAVEIMQIFGTLLTSQANKLSKDLPYADHRRLEICRAIASDPKVILLDEPSAGMDSMETMKLMNDLLKVKSALPHLTIIVVEHDMDFIKGLVDKVMVLNYGQNIALGNFDEVDQNEAVIKAYLGQEEEN